MRVNTGASLTADHIIGGALVIGGNSGAGATVTIAASDSTGNPTSEAGGLALAGSLGQTKPLATSAITAGSLLADGSAAGSLGSVTSLGVSLGGGTAAVPEPSALLLVAVGGLAALAVRTTKSRRSEKR